VEDTEAVAIATRLPRAAPPIRDQYLVVLARQPEDEMAASGSTLADELVTRHGGQVLHVYQSAPRGFAARMTEAQASAGGADLYVKAGALPTTTSYDCRPYPTCRAPTATSRACR